MSFPSRETQMVYKNSVKEETPIQLTDTHNPNTRAATVETGISSHFFSTYGKVDFGWFCFDLIFWHPTSSETQQSINRLQQQVWPPLTY